MNGLLPLRCTAKPDRGFSLVEVLLAILILGIGIISIAALFPAGIAQQRLANDDVMGPIVANHAISIIRSRVRQEDFGTFDEYARFFPDAAPQAYFSRTLPGDWDWMRPGFLLEDDDGTERFNERGAIDIFSHRLTNQERNNNWDPIDVASEFPDGWPEPDFWSGMGGATDRIPLWGIPFNTELYYDFSLGLPSPPNFVISQRERYYPMQTELANNEGKPRPQYVWDCMFRRHQGRVYVAIFVYRVSANDTSAPFIVPADVENPDFPPIPYRINFIDDDGPPQYSGARNVWIDGNGRSTPFILGSENVSSIVDFNPDEHVEAWQHNRQWLLDQNNNIHRVVGIEHDDGENVIRVELTRPLQPARLGWWWNNTADPPADSYPAPFQQVHPPSDSPDFYFADPNDNATVVDFPFIFDGVVTDLWYIPRIVEVDDVEFTLTPVFVTVKEL